MKSEKNFQPIKIELELNTLEEARELWHRLNSGIIDIPSTDEFFHLHPVGMRESKALSDLWEKIDEDIAPFEGK